MRVLVLLCSTAILTMHVLHAADVSDRPAQACAAPRVSQKSWRTVTARSCGIRLRLPPRYVEKRWAVTVGDFVGASYRAGHFDRIDITAFRGADAQFGKVHRQSDYHGYSECSVEIARHKATIQSFRGGGVIFDGGRSSAPFVVAATLELRPGHTLQFMCSASNRQSQDEILAILRTVQVLQ